MTLSNLEGQFSCFKTFLNSMSHNEAYLTIRLPMINNNLATANKSRVSCAHITLKASINSSTLYHFSVIWR